MKRIREIFLSETGYMEFFISILAMSLGYGIYKGVIDNYLAEIVTMDSFDRGVAEFFRELPGLALVFILAVFYKKSVESMYKIGALIMVVGMAMHFAVPPSRALITIAICIYSLGDHIQFGMKNTITLKYARPRCSGAALGVQNALGQVGTLAGYVVIIVAFSFLSGVWAYRAFFLVAALILAVGLWRSSKIHGQSVTDRSKSRFYFRKKFTKYYFLEVFYGARKQVFLTFGPYVLILVYKAGAGTISLLFAVSAICCFIAAPFVGKLIDRVGYKAVMVSDTIILVVVCFFYGFAHHLFSERVAFYVCCVNYVLDSVISLASMASNVYVQDISDSADEVRATISTGISVNHMITVLIALTGGWIWKALGIETLFIVSAVLGLLNSAYAASIKGSGKMRKTA